MVAPGCRGGGGSTTSSPLVRPGTVDEEAPVAGAGQWAMKIGEEHAHGDAAGGCEQLALEAVVLNN